MNKDAHTMKHYHHHNDHEALKRAASLHIFTCKNVKRRLTVTEYVDIDTGEIISAEEAQKLGVRSIRPDAQQQREKAIRRLRKEPREFAEFLLKFRDGSCGFLVPLEVIVGWYAAMTGKRPSSVRRYFPSLAVAGILDEDLILTEVFMINNPRSGKAEAKGALSKAYNIYDALCRRALESE